jgi:5-methylcytosine-specific restriction protein A
MAIQRDLYDSPAWQTIRARQLKRHPWCVVCLQLGIRTRAIEVDHIVSARLGGGALVPMNLQSLCRSHHSQKTARSPERGAYQSRRAFTVIGADGYSLPAGLLPPERDHDE